MNDVPLAAQIAELERELKMRERAYPKFIERGTLTTTKAERQIQALAAAILTLRRVASATVA